MTRIILMALLLVTGCTSAPEGVEPVRSFELERYLGTWYEVARLDHSFERGLRDVTADYSMREDGGIHVINRGVREDTGEVSEAIGRAYPVGQPSVAHLKVSFFGPFFGAYVVFELDAEYRYAFVSGPNRDYLWLLARTPQVSEAVMTRFRQRATELGFRLDGLIVNSDGH
ncbi:lipocalin [Ferrimonas sediminicola]|uniref:Outer membrane lipoprotein Blc n=1 Tax=Ferrimonas sediminicola TaxID=2569538 RepID=A0A4U1BBU5_9GAMM|nr:lipocalin family protein [Ferrimonas sediminicola]TKB48421.1 lipocalin [Ferrimonas sediminicola]